jgi:hypothetical protein
MPTSRTVMKTLTRMPLILALALICVAGGGCATFVDQVVETAIYNIGGGKQECMYDRLWREADDDWRRRNPGY